MLDAELQQRACEYYALANRPEDDELLQNICEEMPPFPPRESALLGRLNNKYGDTEDKRTWIAGGKDANLDREAISKMKTSTETNGNGTNGAQAAPAGAESEIMASLAGLDLSTPSPSVPDKPNPAAAEPAAMQGPLISHWFDKLCYTGEGILYEDVQIQMGIKTEYHGHMGRLAIYFGNKIAAPLTSFTATVKSADPDALSLTFAKIPPNTVQPRAQTQQILHIECKKFFATPPVLTVSFIAGSHQSLSIRLPIIITKFFEGVKLGPQDFFERWKLIGGPPREAQRIFPIELDTAGHVDIAKNRKVISGQRFALLDDVDPNPVNLVAAGVLHMSEAGKVGCLVRVEPNREAKVRPTQHLMIYSRL